MSSPSNLNTAYRLVRRADAQWVPVPETAKGHGAARPGTTLLAQLLLAAFPLAAAAGPPGATTLPAGGTLAAGQANWQRQGNTLTVNQASQRAVIDWQSFNLGSQASVVFNQAAGKAGATLNRVLDNQPSQILGRIQAPGQVFISNPAGVIFGSSASVDVGGLVATTMATSNADFMAGNGTWQRNGSTGAVINQGTLTATDGGFIALLAPEVRNEGVVVARAGTVALAAGETVRLEFEGPGLASVLVSPATLKTLVENRRAILAQDGIVILSARSVDALRSGVVNQTGVIDASSLVSRGGRVLLEGDDITLAAGSRIDASGATGGGTVHVGGGWQGSGGGHAATTVTMAKGATIDARATRQGDGGEVVLWSDVGRSNSRTDAHGRIDARAGAEGGNGGRVETSGHTLDTRGVRVDASAAKGQGGRWLLDPTDLTIDATGANDIVTTLQTGTDVAVQTAATGGDAGHLTVASGIHWTSAADLTLDAAGNIVVKAPITAEHANAVLTLKYGQGAVAAGNTANYLVQAPIGLAAGPNFVTQRGSDGAPITHTVITALGLEGDTGGTTLQGMRGDLAGHYVLGASIDATGVGAWNSGAGFAPVGDNSTPFTGTLDGLGHTVSGLTINRPSTNYVGLFGATNAASIRNLGLANVSITSQGNVGALAGFLGPNTTVSTVYATGTVNTPGMAGGLAGSLSGGVTVSDSYVGVNVNAAGSGWVGGVTGDQSGGTLTRVYSTGNVVGFGNIGSLVGGKNGNLVDSFASGSVNGGGAILHGYNFGGGNTNSGTRNASQMRQASTFGTWDFNNTWTIYEGQTTPLLNAFLVPVTVTAAGNKTYDGTRVASLADAALSVEGARTELLGTMLYSTGSNAGTYGGVTVAGLYSNQQGYRISYAPLSTLTIDPKALTVANAGASNKVYDGGVGATVTGTLQGVVGGDSVQLQASGNFPDKNVGDGKAVTASFGLTGVSAGNYTVTQPTGLAADITPATLALAGAAAANKVYDGTAAATVTVGSLNGVIGNDDVVLGTANATFADKNVGDGKAVTASFVLTGADAGNYTVGQPTGLAANITPAALAVTGAIAAHKVYDGTTAATVTGGSLAGVFGNDDVSLSAGDATFADKNVGTGKAVGTSFVLAGSDAGNYVLAPVTGLTADITPAVLTVANLAAASKVYDGHATATVTGSLGGVLGDDAVSLQAAGAQFADANVGVAKAVTAHFTLTGVDAGNYVLAANPTDGLSADITRLASVSWVGGASGNWFDAANWAGGAVPTRDNVANVVIPQGTVVSLADGALIDAPMLTSVTGAGGLSIVQQALSATGAVSLGSVAVGNGAELVAGSLATPSLVQTGGRIVLAGALTVDGRFEQADGLIRAGGAARITQAAGDLTVRHLVADGVTLSAGDGGLTLGNVGSIGDARLHAASDIGQTDGGSLTVLGAVDATAGGDVRLDQARNMVVGTVSAQGRDVRLTQAIDDLVLGNVIATGELAVTATTGHVRQAVDTTLTVAGTTSATAAQGSVYLMNDGNRFGGAVSASGADIGLTQGATPLVLGTVAASGSLAVKSGGAVSQTGAVTVASRTSIDATGQDVVLDRADNDFVGVVTARTGALTLADGIGGLTLGHVQTSGATRIESKGGAILQSGTFATTSGTLSVFNAWLDGLYAPVSVNTVAAVQINGEIYGTAGGTSVGGSIGRALNALSWATLPVANADAKATDRSASGSGQLVLPAAVPVKAD